MSMSGLTQESGVPPAEISWSNRLLQYLVLTVVFLLLGWLLFSSTGRDDAYITYWPAHTLSQYAEILNYNGDRVEQSSSMLHVLILAALSKVTGLGVAKLGGGLTILFGLLTLYALHHLASKIESPAAFPAALLTATSAFFVYWAFGGLETTLVPLIAIILILSWSGLLNRSRLHIRSLCISLVASLLFVLTRPEMPLVLIAMLLGFLLIVMIRKITGAPKSSVEENGLLTRLSILLFAVVVVCCLVFLFRILYFGRWFPQPVYAKSAGLSWDVLNQGMTYLGSSLFSNVSMTVVTVLTICGLLAAAWKQIRSYPIAPAAVLSLLFVLVYICFIILSGGDWMEGGRFTAHLIPPAVFFLALGVCTIVKSRRLLFLLFSLLVSVQVKTVVDFAVSESTGVPAWAGLKINGTFAREYNREGYSWLERTNRIHMRDIPSVYYLDLIVDKLSEYKNDTVVLMGGQMGMIAYYVTKWNFRDIRIIDRYGLTDRTFTDCAALGKVYKTPLGIALNPRSYTQLLEGVRNECGIERPDIVFDIFRFPKELNTMGKIGYKLYYVQHGFISSGSEFFPGAEVTSNQFIAVRADLADALEDFEPVRINFDKLQ
jgi:hypothetical protein